LVEHQVLGTRQKGDSHRGAEDDGEPDLGHAVNVGEDVIGTGIIRYVNSLEE
jgi:hypothetical protein